MRLPTLRVGHLLLAWVAYWVTFAVVRLREPISVARRVAGLPDGRGHIEGSIGDEGLSLSMQQDGAVVWSGETSIGALLLRLAIPPLAIWVLWMIARRQAAVRGVTPPPVHVALGPGARDLPAPGGIAGGANEAEREAEREPERVPRGGIRP